IYDHLSSLPPKSQLQSRWHKMDEIARLCTVYVAQKKAKLNGTRTSEKLDTVETLLYQVKLRKQGEEERAQKLYDRITAQPTEWRLGRHSPGKGVAPIYSWEKVPKPGVRIHGKDLRDVAGQENENNNLGKIEFRGKNYTEVYADDLYALKALCKGLEWQQVEQKVDWLRKLNYLGPEESAEYRLNFIGSAVYNSHGQLADTSTAMMDNDPGFAPYAASQDGDVYIKADYVDYRDAGAWQHSSLLGGQSVMCAGTIKIRDGQLRTISNMSGHYKPGLDELLDVCKAIKSQYEDNDNKAYVFYKDYESRFGSPGAAYMFPLSLFTDSNGRPPDPSDFECDCITKPAHRPINFYKNPMIALARASTPDW